VELTSLLSSRDCRTLTVAVKLLAVAGTTIDFSPLIGLIVYWGKTLTTRPGRHEHLILME
jgi:hypothetical protein